MILTKENHTLRSRPGFGTFLGIIITLVIIGLLYCMMFKGYLGRGSFGKDAGKNLAEEGIDTSNPKTLIDSTKTKVDEINKQILDRSRHMDFE